MSTALVLLAAFAASWGGVRLMLRYARRRLVDMPNERSSHATPTPRGGGLPIALVFLVAVAALQSTGGIDPGLAVALLGGGLLTAGTGFWDDHRPLSAPLRLFLQSVAVVTAVVAIGPLENLRVGSVSIDLGPAGWVLSVVGYLWLINLFNFMDGIDGLAASETLFVIAGAALVARMADHAIPPGMGVLGAATAGFLVLNWPPARIFMGDVGSGFLGFALGAFALHTAREAPALAWCWVILLGYFVSDATATLLRRMVSGARVHQAHRSHLYQLLAARFRSHRKVTLGVVALNVFGLLPVALLAVLRPELGCGLALGSLALLMLGCLRAGAGIEPERG